MSVVEWPEGIYLSREVYCVVCKTNLQIFDATIGAVDTSDRPAFACNTHLGLGESSRFLRAWIEFAVMQKRISNIGALAQERGEGQTW